MCPRPSHHETASGSAVVTNYPGLETDGEDIDDDMPGGMDDDLMGAYEFMVLRAPCSVGGTVYNPSGKVYIRAMINGVWTAVVPDALVSIGTNPAEAIQLTTSNLNCYATLGTSCVISAPMETDVPDGTRIRLRVVSEATSGTIITLNAGLWQTSEFNVGALTFPWTATAAAVYSLFFEYDAVQIEWRLVHIEGGLPV